MTLEAITAELQAIYEAEGKPCGWSEWLDRIKAQRMRRRLWLKKNQGAAFEVAHEEKVARRG